MSRTTVVRFVSAPFDHHGSWIGIHDPYCDVIDEYSAVQYSAVQWTGIGALIIMIMASLIAPKKMKAGFEACCTGKVLYSLLSRGAIQYTTLALKLGS